MYIDIVGVKRRSSLTEILWLLAKMKERKKQKRYRCFHVICSNGEKSHKKTTQPGTLIGMRERVTPLTLCSEFTIYGLCSGIIY